MLQTPELSDYFISYLSAGDRDSISWKHGGSTDHAAVVLPTFTRNNLPDWTFADNADLVLDEHLEYHEDADPGKFLKMVL